MCTTGRIRSASLLLGLLLGAVIIISAAGAAQSKDQDQKPPSIPRDKPLRNVRIPASKGWVDCGWHIFQGQNIELWAEGEIFCKKGGAESCGPDGYPNTAGGFWKPIPKANTGALIGKIGAKSTRYFYVGSHAVVKAWLPGRLYLRVNDDNSFDNKGEFKVYLGFH